LLTTTQIIIIACVAALVFASGIGIYLTHLYGFDRCAKRAKKLFCNEDKKKVKNGDKEEELDKIRN